MSAAPEHAPTMAKMSLTERLAPHAPILLVIALIPAGLVALPATSSWLTPT